MRERRWDQLYAQRFGQDSPLPSLQLSIENLAQSGACAYGYSCVYTDSICWATPTDPLPMTRNPRVIFEQLFGDGVTEKERTVRRQKSRSILDWITREVARLKPDLGVNDRNRLTEYLDDIREVERRIQKIEGHNASGEARELPDAPIGVPDDWEEHVKLMFDMQALAFMAGITNVSAFKMSRDTNKPSLGPNRSQSRVPLCVPSRRATRTSRRLRQDQPLPPEPSSVFSGEVEELARRRR